MQGCSLNDAFGPFNQEARKNERRRQKKCKTATAATTTQDPDPDRQNFVKKPIPEAFGSEPQPSYFGKDPSEDFTPFTHVIGDNKEYTLQPDFKDAFNQIGTVDGAGATAALPTPSISDVWKPLTPSGTYTAYFDTLPEPKPKPVEPSENKVLQAKLDKIFSRLDELETMRAGDAANAQTEVLLFIMSGIFVLFLTDLAVRKASN